MNTNRLRKAFAALVTATATMLPVTMMNAHALATEEGVQKTYSIITDQLPLKNDTLTEDCPAFNSCLSRPVFQLNDLNLQANQPYGLSASMQTKAEYLGSLQGQVMYCDSDAPGVAGQYSAWTTTNHLGEENNADPNQVVTTSGQWLFTPTADGTYDCTLYGRGGRNPYPADHPLEHLNVVGGNLAIDMAPRPGGTEWRQPTVEKVGNGLYPFAPDLPYPDTKWVLIKKWDAPTSTGLVSKFPGRKKTLVNNGLPKVRIRTETELSAISIGQAGDATADITTYVTQLNPDGTKCGDNRITQTTRAAIPSKLHHLKVGQTLLATYDSSCSNRFAIQVLIDYVDNQGMQVEGSSYTSAHIHPWS